jgi:MerR family transcriptional regulator, light-induced transcriptional regulator
MNQENELENGLSIGAVSRETGVPIETLRTWERRYGVPDPIRTPSGHRVYPQNTIPHIRLIAEAVSRGDRASRACTLSFEELQARVETLREQDLLRQAPTPVPADAEVAGLPRMLDLAPARDPSQEDIARTWVDHARNLDGDSLDTSFRSDWASLGALRFLSERVGPFLHELGEAWVSGAIDVYHEHFASERLRDFLTSTWRPLSDTARGPVVVCATLPGERHALGLHMAASVVALAGCRITFLGSDTPISDIEGGARQSDAAGVVLSVSQAADTSRVRDALRMLRSRLPAEMRIVVGGLGAPGDVDGVDTVRSMADLSAWAHRLRQSRAR